MLAGWLPAQIQDTFVRIDYSDELVELRGNRPADIQSLEAFFSAPNGQAGSVTVDGSLVVAGREITGSFQLSEFGDREQNGGVSVAAANAELTFGDTAGVELKNGDGAFTLLQTGVAGVVTADDQFSDDVTVFGVTGLQLDANAGLQFEINTTGRAVNQTVNSPGGAVIINFPGDLEQLSGPAEFYVASSLGKATAVDADFRIFESQSGLALTGGDVSVRLFSGDIHALTMSSGEAFFGLQDEEFGLLADTQFAVSGFAIFPDDNVGEPDGEIGEAGEFQLKKATVGPMTVTKLKATLPTFSISEGAVRVDVGLAAKEASFSYSQAASAAGDENAAKPIEATATLPGGSLRLSGAIDEGSGLVIDTFSGIELHTSKFELSVPDVFTATALNVDITYDPQADESQELFSAEAVDIELTAISTDISASFSSTDATPALLVREDGFAFGKGRVTFSQSGENTAYQISPFLSIDKPFIQLTDFSYFKSTGLDVGGFGVGAGTLSVGDPTTSSVNFSGSDIGGFVTFDAQDRVEEVKFTAGSLTANLGEFLSLSGSDITFVPTATDDEEMLRVAGAVSASVAAGGLSITGTASKFSVLANGEFNALPGFAVSLNAQELTPGSFQWPSFLPLQISSVGVQWPHLNERPEDFRIVVSASLNGDFAGFSLLKVSGSVTGLAIEPARVRDGEFPIVDIEGLTASVEGNLFGGQVNASVIAGVVKLDEEGSRLPDSSLEFADSVFYAGIIGGFEFAGLAGVELRVGFSEQGPLAAYLTTKVPGGILLDPFSGLSVNNFRAGVTFNALPLPTPSDPTGLLAPIFKPTTQLTAEQWQDIMKQQVAAQASGNNGFLFDYTSNVGASLVQLNSGFLDSGFEKAFTTRGYAIKEKGAKPTVTTLDFNNLWHIQFKGNQYLVEKIGELGSLKLRVSGIGFSACVGDDGFNCDTLTAALGTGGAVDPAVISLFEANEINLTTAAMVEVVQTDDTDQPVRWKITDEGRPYFVSQQPHGDGGALLVTGGAGTFADMENIIRVEAGGTIYSAYTSENAFKGDIDLIVTTDGKFLIVAELTLANSITADARLFGDLSSLDEAQPEDPLRFLFLGDFPAKSSGLPRAFRLQGDMTFEFLDAEGNLVNPAYTDPASFRFTALGKGEVTSFDFATLVIGGDGGDSGEFAELQITIEDTPDVEKFQLDFSGSLSMEGIIPASDFVSGAGSLTVQKADDKLEVFGAVKLDFTTDITGLSFLEEAGLTADAELLLGMNSSAERKDVVLQLPGRSEEIIVLDPATLLLEGEGSLRFQNEVFGFAGADIAFDGAFSARIKRDLADDPADPDPTRRGDGGFDLDLFLAGRLEINLVALDQQLNFLTIDALGMVAVRDIGALVNDDVLPPQAAGRIDLFVERSLEGIIELEGSAQLLFNSLGQEFVYLIPDRLQDRLKAIRARRRGVSPNDVTLPDLPAVINPTTGEEQLTVTVPDRPPALLNGDQFAPGPYFVLQFGDIDESTPPGGNPDPDGDGLVDVSVTILDTLRLEGDMRILVGVANQSDVNVTLDDAARGGFELAISANISLAAPGAEDLLDTEVSGLLRITKEGLVGAIGMQSAFDIPGVNLSGNVEAFVGVNTTNRAADLQFQNASLPNRQLLPQAAEIYVGGTLEIGGFDLDGSFRMLVSSQALELEVDASVSFFNVNAAQVDGSAAIYYGLPAGQNGLVLDVGLTIGDDDQTFGVPHVFEVGGSLRLHLDTRADTAQFEIQVRDVTVEVLEVLDFTGSASITAGRDASGQGFFRMEGEFEASLFDSEVAGLSAEGFFDSRGEFSIHVFGGITLGTEDWGIQGGVDIFVERIPSQNVCIDFSGSGFGRIRAFGTTLFGVTIGVDYDGEHEGGDGAINIFAALELPRRQGREISFTVGHLACNPVGDPDLARLEGNELVLNVGADANLRNVAPTSKNESYTISSSGAGSPTGEIIVVEGFGSREVFRNVTSIRGDFGDGKDQVRILQGVGAHGGVSIDLSGGDDDDQMVNESSSVGVTFRGGAGNDRLFGSGAGDTLLGEADDDLLAGGAGADILRGGNGNDQLNWQGGRGADIEISGGADEDTLIVTGTNQSEAFTIDNFFGLVRVNVSGPSAESTLASGIETLDIEAQGGADSVVLHTPTLASLGISRVGLDLSRTPGQRAFLDDGAADTLTVIGGAAGETFSLNPNNDPNSSINDAVLNTAGLSIGLIQPGKFEDVVQIFGQGGADTLEVIGPNYGGISTAQKINNIQLFGDTGDDTFRLPIGGATFDENGPGADQAIFTVTSGDKTDVTVTANRIFNGEQSSSYSNLASVGVEALTPIDLTVQSTHTNPTRVTLQGTMAVRSTAGPLNVTLNGAASATFEGTSGATTVSGSGLASQVVQVGGGQLSRIGGPLSVGHVGTLIYDNSLDGPDRTLDLTGVSLTGGGVLSSLTHTGTTAMELRTGLGDDIVNVAINASSVSIVGHGQQDQDQVNVTMNGTPRLTTPTPGAVTTVDADTVRFENNGNFQPTAWRLDQGQLQGDGLLLLNASTADLLDIALGEGDANTILALRIEQSTDLQLRGENNTLTIGGESVGDLVDITLDHIDADLNITATTESNTLILDDSLSTQGRRRHFVGHEVLRSDEQNGAIVYSPEIFSSIQVFLGSGADEAIIEDASKLDFVSGGAGDDTFEVRGAVGSLRIEGGPKAGQPIPSNDDDVLTVFAGEGSINFQGGPDRDEAVFERSDEVIRLIGSATPIEGDLELAIDGMPSVRFDLSQDASDTERVRVILGDGNDELTIDNAVMDTELTVLGGGGDDFIRVDDLLGDRVSSGEAFYELFGESGRDTAWVEIPGVPMPLGEAQLSLQVEELIVNNRDNTQGAVDWRLESDVLHVGGAVLLATTGADHVTILGGNDDADTLEVTNKLPNRDIDATVTNPGVIDGINPDAEIDYSEGFRVATQAGSPLDDFALLQTVDGLGGARAAASTGDYTYVGGSGGGIAVFRHTDEGPQYVAVLSEQNFPGVSALAVSADGQNLYAITTSGGVVNLVEGEIQPRTGLILDVTTTSLIATTGDASLLVSPEDEHLVIVDSVANDGFKAWVFDRGDITSAPKEFSFKQGQNLSVVSVTFDANPDATRRRLYVTTSQEQVILLDWVSADGVLSLQQTINPSEGLYTYAGYTNLQVSDDGRLLFARSLASSVGAFDIYELAPELDGAPVRRLQYLGLGDNELFDYYYDSKSEVLITIEGRIQEYFLTEYVRDVDGLFQQSRVVDSVVNADLLKDPHFSVGRTDAGEVFLTIQAGKVQSGFNTVLFSQPVTNYQLKDGTLMEVGEVPVENQFNRTTGISFESDYVTLAGGGADRTRVVVDYAESASGTREQTRLLLIDPAVDYTANPTGPNGAFDPTTVPHLEQAPPDPRFGQTDVFHEVIDITTHPTNPHVFWTIERESGSPAGSYLELLHLRSYEIVSTFNASANEWEDEILRRDSEVVGEMTFSSPRIEPEWLKFNPDGSHLYLGFDSQQFQSSSVAIWDFQPSTPVDVPGTFVSIDTGDYHLSSSNFGDIAFGNDRLYTTGTVPPSRWSPLATAGFVTFTGEEFSAEFKLYGDYFNRFDLDSMSASATSADGNRIYLGKDDGTLLTLQPGEEGRALSLDERQAFASEVIELQVHTNYLLALTADNQAHRIALDAEMLPTGAVVSVTTSSGSAEFAVSGDQLVVAASNPDSPEASFFELPTSGFGARTDFSQNDALQTEVEHLSAFAVSRNGDYFYGVSSTENALVATSSDGSDPHVFIDQLGLGEGPVPAFLHGVSALAVGPERTGGGHFVVVASGIENALTVFERKVMGELELRKSLPGAGIPLSLGFDQNGKLIALFDSPTDNLRRYSIDSTGALQEEEPKATLSGAGELWFDEDRTFAYFPTTGELRSYDDLFGAAVQTIGGLAGVTDLAFTANAVYLTRSSGEVRIFTRATAASNLTPAGTIQDGDDGVTGLGGASDVEVSDNGNFVFVAGRDEGVVTVYFRDQDNGQLTFAQSLRNRRGGVRGLADPMFMDFHNNQLIVGGGAGASASERGGFALFDVSTESAENIRPIDLISRFTGIESVELNTKSGDDVIRVFASPDGDVDEFDIRTSLGSDVVNLLAPLPDSDTVADVLLGGGQDTLTINHDGGGTLAADLGDDGDRVYVQSVGADASIELRLRDNTDEADLVYVTGSEIPVGATVIVQGDLRNAVTTGDALIYDTADGILDDSAFGSSAGSLRLFDAASSAISGNVTFDTMRFLASTDPLNQVFHDAAPRPRIASLAPINEGGSLTLTATDADAPFAGDIDVAWDIDGDGQFGDALGATVSLGWEELQAFGIDDSGQYPLAVRATRETRLAQFGGEDLRLSSDALAELTVNNVAPTLSVAAPANAELGRETTVLFDVIDDPGDDRVTIWRVAWGDGVVEELGSAATSATHVYVSPGDFSVAVTAADEDGSYSTVQPIQVRPSAASVFAGGPYTILEGGALSTTATAFGEPTRYEWDITSDGVADLFTTAPTLYASWTQLNAAGVNDDGAYQFSVTAVYVVSGDEFAGTSHAVDLTVLNIAPTGALTTSVPAVAEGSGSGSVVLQFTGLTDPAPVDRAAGFTASYDFDNDGNVDLANVPTNQSVTIPAAFLSHSGALTIRATVRDKDGGERDVYASILVEDVPPALSLVHAETVLEDQPLSLTVQVSDHGNDVVNQWVVDWGDGVIETFVGNGQASQGFSHRYADGAATGTEYIISVTARQDEANTTTEDAVRVFDVAPLISLDTTTPVVVEGKTDAFHLTWSVTDPGTDQTQQFVIDWGDGAADTVSGDVNDLTHTYADVPDGGTYTVRVTSTNEDGTFTNLPSEDVVVSILNVAPTIADELLRIPSLGQEAAPLTLSAIATSVAGSAPEPLTFQWIITPTDGQSFPPTAGETILANQMQLPGVTFAAQDEVTFVPADQGVYQVTLIVTDDEGASAQVTREIQVANRSPRIDVFDVPSPGVEGEVISLFAVASDPAGAADPLSYEWTITHAHTGDVQTLAGASSTFVSDGGQYSVHLLVSDGDGGIAVRSKAVAMAPLPPLIDPSTLQIPSTSVEGATDSFSVSATDQQAGESLSFQWRIIGPDGKLALLDGANVQFTWPDDGQYEVRVVVIDNENLAAQSEPLTVTVGNLPPSIVSTVLPVGLLPEGQPFSLSAMAVDPAGPRDTIDYRWTLVGPNGKSQEVYGAQATFTPPDDGTYEVQLTVNDREGGVAMGAVAFLEVHNVDPGVGQIDTLATDAVEGSEVTLRVEVATDVVGDVDDLLYTWTVSRPDGSSFDLAGREIQFTAFDDGNHAVQLLVRDGDGGAAERNAVISVVNVDPVLQSVSLPTLGYLGFGVELAASADDVAADLADLTYQWEIVDPDDQTTSLDGAAAEFVPLTSGLHTVTLTVTDGDGGQATASGDFVVNASTVDLTTFEVVDTIGEAIVATFHAAANDAFGAEVVYNWTIADPVGATTLLSGPITSFTPADDGVYDVSLTASSINGEATIFSTLEVVNRPPVLSSFSVPNRATATLPTVLSAAASDPAGVADPVAYEWTVTNPDGSHVLLSGEEVVFTPHQTGFHGVRLRVTDGDGGEVVVQDVMAVLNTPPTANAGDSYEVLEGDDIMLDGLKGSFDLEDGAAALVYEWDLDDDGVFGETGADATLGNELGHSPLFTAANLDGPSDVMVKLRVTDSEGVTDNDSVLIHIANVAPTINAIESSNADLTHKSIDGIVSIGGTFSDPAEDLDTHKVLVNWGDGQTEEVNVDQDLDEFSGAHDYANGGIYTIIVILIDDDGGEAALTTTAVVQGVGLVNKTLYIIGTDGRDHVKLKSNAKKDELSVDVKLNQGRGSDGGSDGSEDRIRRTFVASEIDRVVAFLCDGDDQYDGHLGGSDGGSDGGTDINIPQIVFGGAGDDHLKGGRGNDVLVGGTGKDKLQGDRGDDLLVGGTAENEGHLASVDAAIRAWELEDLSDVLLQLGSIYDDGEKDTLDGQQGIDHFVPGAKDKVKR